MMYESNNEKADKHKKINKYFVLHTYLILAMFLELKFFLHVILHIIYLNSPPFQCLYHIFIEKSFPKNQYIFKKHLTARYTICCFPF